MISMESTTLGEICNLITDGKHGDCENDTDSGFYFLSAKDVRDGKLNYDGARQITEADFLDTHRRTQLEPNDLLISNSGTIGRMALARNQPETGRTTFQKSVAIIKPKHERVCVEWLYYYLHCDLERLVAFAGGTAQKNLLLRDLRAFKVELPPLWFQHKIASILSAYDDLIENNTRRIAILEEMAQAIYRQWFVNFQFPGHENVKLVDSPLGEIAEGWEAATLGECLSILETGNRPKGGVAEITEGVPSIGAESIVGAGQFDFSKTKYVPTEYFEKMKKGVVEDRDVLVYKDGGKPGYFIPHVSLFGSGFPFHVMALNSHVYRLRGTEGVSQEFLYYHLSSEEMLHWMHLNGSGAAIPSIARKDLVRMPVALPTPILMEKFTKVAGDGLSEILTLARKSQNLRTTRDLLLPKLISGKLDVEDLDIDVGETLEELEEATT